MKNWLIGALALAVVAVLAGTGAAVLLAPA